MKIYLIFVFLLYDMKVYYADFFQNFNEHSKLQLQDIKLKMDLFMVMVNNFNNYIIMVS